MQDILTSAFRREQCTQCIWLPKFATGPLAGQLSRLRIDHQQQRRELRSATQRLEMPATHDEMTGLPNRRHVQEWVAHEVARSHRSGATLGMAILDIDHFKRVNDTLGHAVGDTVLRITRRVSCAKMRNTVSPTA